MLRGLEYLRGAGVTPDERVAEAIELVEARRRRAVAARDPVSRRDASRDGRGRGPTEPVEHLTRPARAPLVRLLRRADDGKQQPFASAVLDAPEHVLSARYALMLSRTLLVSRSRGCTVHPPTLSDKMIYGRVMPQSRSCSGSEVGFEEKAVDLLQARFSVPIHSWPLLSR